MVLEVLLKEPKKQDFKHVWGVDNHEDSCKSFEDNQGCKSYFEDIENFTKEETKEN